MATAMREEVDDALERTLAEGSAAFAVFTTGQDRTHQRTRGTGAAAWLTPTRTRLVFRTARGARFAGLQLARAGYPAVVGPGWLTAEAPWIVLSTVMAAAGIGTEILGATWARVHPPMMTKRIPGSA